MATIQELRTSRTKLLLDAQKLASKPNVTKEERATAHAMLADVDLIEQDIAIEERVAKAQAEERAMGRPPRSQPGEQEITPESTKQERRAFADYIRFGRVDSNVLRENRDLGVGAVAGKHLTLEGQENDVTTAGLARMNMILHNFPTANILQGNTLSSPKFKDGAQLRTYDYVVANPPFSDKSWSTGLTPEKDYFQRFAWGVPPRKQPG